MNNIKKVFSIKDLENLSGIKAHTIRIWEKRYNLLTPMRTDTNIRSYSLESLQKLLNITLLYQNGYKISKIAALPEASISTLAKDIVNENSIQNKSINAFKLSMVNFDQTLFFQTYEALAAQKSFQKIFHEIFIPLLNELGLLWQTATITPAHEHFISNLIKQKILINTERLQKVNSTEASKTFVLYLPENEIHEIGLLFLNYELLARGYHTVYLGASMPVENLNELCSYYNNINFVTYFTVAPPTEKISDYLNRFQEIISTEHQLWIIGKQLKKLIVTELPSNIQPYSSIPDLVKKL